MCNFSPVVHRDYRLGLPGPGFYREIVNTDSEWYGGSNVGNDGGVQAEPVAVSRLGLFRRLYASSLGRVLARDRD